MISKTLQEWANETGMIGTISTFGIIILHEKEPELIKSKNVKKIYKITGKYIALSKEQVSDNGNYGILIRPNKDK